MLFRSKYISLLICVLWGISSQAQVYFNEVREPLFCTGVYVKDSSFIVNGWKVRPDTVWNTNIHRDFFFTEFDFQGNLLDSLFVPNDFGGGTGQWDGIHEMPDGNLIQPGFLQNDVVDGGYAHAVIFKKDLSDTIKTVQFRWQDSLHSYWDYMDISDDHFIFGAGRMSDTTGNIGNGAYRIPWYFKMDTAFNLIWETLIPEASFLGGTPKSISATEDGGCVVGLIVAQPQNTDQYDGYIIKLDSLGNEEWRHKMYSLSSDRYDSGPAVLYGSDGYVYACQQRALISSYLASVPWYGEPNRIGLVKLDLSGNVIWDKNYGNSNILATDGTSTLYTSHFEPRRIKESASGDIYITGTNQYSSGIFKTNHQGDSIYMRELDNRLGNFPNDPINFLKEKSKLYDFGFVGDTSILCVGQYEGYPWGAVYPDGAQLNWFVMLDEYGCDSVGCQFISVPESSTPSSDLSIYPNPVSNILRLEGAKSDEYEVYDLLGRLILQGTLEYEIDVSELPSGTYIFRVGNESRRFVKE